MATKREVNWKLLKECRDLFNKKPSKSYMSGYCVLKAKYQGVIPEGQEVPICKTHLCIGGSALLLSGEYKGIAEGWSVSITDLRGNSVTDYWKAAKRVLGLTQPQAIQLFNEPCWPEQFHSNNNTIGSRTLAHNMVRRINHFIKTKGRE